MPTSDYKRRKRANAAAGGLAGAYFLGAPAAVGAQQAGIRATRRAAANETKLRDAAPTWRKYEKVKNLADRAGTEGEGAAARGMADKLKAKAEGEQKAARRSIKGYRTTKVVAHLAKPKAALVTGFGATAAAGASLGAAATQKPKRKKATLAKRDYTVAQQKWERREARANRVENTGQGVAGAAGGALGGAALRDAAFNDYPGFKQKMQLRSMDVPTKVGRKAAEAVMHGKPGLKTMGTVAAGSVVAATGTRSKKIANKRARRLEEMSKAQEPGRLAHQADLELAKSATMGNRELAHRKKVQSATTIAGSTLGLAALGTLGGAKLLPKATKLGKTPRGQAYARHLDRAAQQLSIGAGGVGGVGGYNFAAIQRAEAKKVEPKTKVAKALSDRNLARTLNLAFNGKQQDTRIRATNLYMRAKTRGEKKVVPVAARKQKKVARVIERANAGQKWSPVKGD
jgi:hypothetical protein